MSSKHWLFLRGKLDDNNNQQYNDDTDMWLQLARKLDPGCKIWYKGFPLSLLGNSITHIFCRGGFPFYNKVLKQFPKAYKIYYGSGIRFNPDKKIKYDLILVDSDEQYKIVSRHHPDTNVQKWFKPAANHFQVMPEVKKIYDICFVSDCHSKFQEKIKRVKWVYENVPSHYRVLHLGQSKIPITRGNITSVKVSKLDMPYHMNQCKFGIIPYKNYDSTPRVLPEMHACGLPVVTLEVPYWDFMYQPLKTWTFRRNKKTIWDEFDNLDVVTPKAVRKDYDKYISMDKCVEHLRRLIDGTKT